MAAVNNPSLGAAAESAPEAPKAAPVVLAGITLQYMKPEDALRQLGMTQGELLTVMNPNSSWPFAGCQDGWKIAHDAIRFDLENFLEAIRKTKKQVDSGQALQSWQVDAFRTIIKDFYHNVHLHHDHEEDILFTHVSTRVQLPPKMSSDHKTLMAALDHVRELCCNSLKADSKQEATQAVLSDLLSTFTEMDALMRHHLEEEEIIGLPMVRKAFTAKEYMVAEKKIVADLKPSDMAWALRHMTPELRQELMTRVGIPGFIQKLVIQPAVKKDQNSILRLYRELAAGEQMPPKPKRRGFLCFAA